MNKETLKFGENVLNKLCFKESNSFKFSKYKQYCCFLER